MAPRNRRTERRCHRNSYWGEYPKAANLLVRVGIAAMLEHFFIFPQVGSSHTPALEGTAKLRCRGQGSTVGCTRTAELYGYTTFVRNCIYVQVWRSKVLCFTPLPEDTQVNTTDLFFRRRDVYFPPSYGACVRNTSWCHHRYAKSCQ